MSTLALQLGALSRRPAASHAEIAALARTLGRTLPADYKRFLLWSNGIEGVLGSTSYLILWAASEVGPLSDGYGVAEAIPNAVLIGTDGADTGYGIIWGLSGVTYISVPLVGMSVSDVYEFGTTFHDFIDGARNRTDLI